MIWATLFSNVYSTLGACVQPESAFSLFTSTFCLATWGLLKRSVGFQKQRQCQCPPVLYRAVSTREDHSVGLTPSRSSWSLKLCKHRCLPDAGSGRQKPLPLHSYRNPVLGARVQRSLLVHSQVGRIKGQRTQESSCLLLSAAGWTPYPSQSQVLSARLVRVRSHREGVIDLKPCLFFTEISPKVLSAWICVTNTYSGLILY